MSEPAPYTGTPAQQPPPPPPPVTVAVRHSRVLLVAVAAAALVAAILTGVGSSGFPNAAPVEQIYAFGLIVDLVAVIVTVGVLLTVEVIRRGNPARTGLPADPRPSVFAIVALALAALALAAFLTTGAAEQLVLLVQGARGRYMYWTGGLFATGIPWALSGIFGAWGVRPGGHRTTNILAAIALVIWLLLAALSTAAALIYGAGLSD